jgi:hypothetical protein
MDFQSLPLDMLVWFLSETACKVQGRRFGSDAETDVTYVAWFDVLVFCRRLDLNGEA